MMSCTSATYFILQDRPATTYEQAKQDVQDRSLSKDEEPSCQQLCSEVLQEYTLLRERSVYA